MSQLLVGVNDSYQLKSSMSSKSKNNDTYPKALADPGFPDLGGSTNPQGGGANLLFCPIFPVTKMK